MARQRISVVPLIEVPRENFAATKFVKTVASLPIE
jgi:hypothetical protein